MILPGKIGASRKDGGEGGTNLGEAQGILDEFRAWRSEPGASAALADRGAERTMEATQR